ncbi:MAG: prepilin-type N-terminal cleavage/methylation domain-containing protein [Elusimicrobia bacterium]|nr:prepilin-type N-terminal cleavage/methylation domain-containing protein [Elusimicrobiota bacterium]
MHYKKKALRTSTKHRSRGFSMIELLTVVVIVAALAIMTSTGYRMWLRKAALKEAQVVCNAIAVGEQQYYTETRYTVSSDGAPGNGNTLFAWTTPVSACAALGMNISGNSYFNTMMVAAKGGPGMGSPPALWVCALTGKVGTIAEGISVSASNAGYGYMIGIPSMTITGL